MITMNEKNAPHIEELTRALVNVDRNKIEEQFNRLVEFKVSPDEAKQVILRKFGNEFIFKDISALQEGDKGLMLKVRVLDIEEKVVTLKGVRTTIHSGIMADVSGACYFTAWEDMSLYLDRAYLLKNVVVRQWRGHLEISLNDRCVVEPLPDDELPSLSELSGTARKKLARIDSRDIFVSFVGAVIELYHRDISVKGENMTIVEGVVADDTARLPFVSWCGLDDIDIGSLVLVEKATVNVYRGVPSIRIGGSAVVKEIDAELPLDFTFSSVNRIPSPVPIREVTNRSGMFDVVVCGVLISVRPGSGLIKRCPECNRVLVKDSCRSHGCVKGISDMRIKFFLDDGTGVVLVMFDRELSEIMYGKQMEELESILDDKISSDAIYEDMKKKLTGRYICVRGNSSKVEFGVSLVAKSLCEVPDDLQKRKGAILERMDREL